MHSYVEVKRMHGTIKASIQLEKWSHLRSGSPPCTQPSYIPKYDLQKVSISFNKVVNIMGSWRDIPLMECLQI